MAREVPLRPFRDTFTAPCDENVLGQARIRVCHLHVGKLHSPFREFFDEVYQFAVYSDG